ncbi:hypothetical protein [Streptomyces sp. 5-6(2022)]|uniref:hypothetical protein n=1 Tax=Streptomyces sp. 5-6(2022) TaxID=2936510 RepID=UPI0023B96B49|nr:hypothetical protein [Streptomyces sp. 5-6(2022)]
MDLYVEHGGNFIDTANTYTNGSRCGECAAGGVSEGLGAAGAFEQHRVHDGRPDVRASLDVGRDGWAEI